MKLRISVLAIALFLAACSGSKPPVDNAAVENRKAQNKEIAVKNKVSDLTRLAQKIEKQGREMEIYRRGRDPKNIGECEAAMEDGNKQIADLETRTKNLPENFRIQLTPILTDINECVSCEKEAVNACVKTRTAINTVIKEFYPPK